MVAIDSNGMDSDRLIVDSSRDCRVVVVECVLCFDDCLFVCYTPQSPDHVEFENAMCVSNGKLSQLVINAGGACSTPPPKSTPT